MSSMSFVDLVSSCPEFLGSVFVPPRVFLVVSSNLSVTIIT